MIYIRADANKILATGHIMRCIAIAEAIRELKEEVTFLVAEEEAKEFVHSKGYPCICLHSKWNDLEYELNTLVQLIQKEEIDTILVDSYYVTEYYLSTLKRYVRLAYLDGRNAFLYPVNLLINYNSYYKKWNYEAQYKNRGVTLLLGCSYVPLRSEFQKIKHKESNKIEHVLLTTGGTDQYNMCGRILEYISANKLYSNLQFHVMIGKLNEKKEKLLQLEQDNSNICCYSNVENIAYQMSQCDIAISTGGVSLYELCACNVPTICCLVAENQYDNIDYFTQNGYMVYGGDFRDLSEQPCKKVLDGIEEIEKNYQKYYSKINHFVDGQGAIRIAKELVNR